MFNFIFSNKQPKYRYRILNEQTGDILKLETTKANKTVCRVIKKDTCPFEETVITLSEQDVPTLQAYLNNLYKEGEWRVVCIDDLEMFGIDPK